MNRVDRPHVGGVIATTRPSRVYLVMRPQHVSGYSATKAGIAEHAPVGVAPSSRPLRGSEPRKHWLDDWRPEDPSFWQSTGRRVARRNLVWSILAENIGFSVWLMWSVVAARLPKAGFHYTTDELFLLVALPGLVGALIRFPYTFAVPKFGGRNWTVISALLLLVPTLSLVVAVNDPTTPLWCMALAAASAGLGGGNFASSMANISFFYPDREKGWALGLNAAGGNIGVSSVQLLVPLVVGYSIWPGDAKLVHLENAALMWLPLIALSATGAFFRMDNLSSARSPVRDQMRVAQRKHTWIMAFLYIGTFGSFVGYSAAFPLLLKNQFPEVSVNLAFLGALVGSIMRPVGGWLADRYGGARITFINFVVMAAGSLGLWQAMVDKVLPEFLGIFLLLFISTGIGNGSTFRMIPAIFRALHTASAEGASAETQSLAAKAARRETAAVIGVVSALGALGGFFIPQAFAASIKASGGPELAVSYFSCFYALCVAVTWWCYLRRSFMTTIAPSLAHTRV
jgi:NNP family nitrate/nitrite transporter-like MFS transporter